MNHKFKIGDRVEHRDGSRGTVVDILDTSQPRNPDFVIVWDEDWAEYQKDPSEKGICGFCLGRYLKLEAPTKREELMDSVTYDS